MSIFTPPPFKINRGTYPAPEAKAVTASPGFSSVGFVPIDARGGTADVAVESTSWYRVMWLVYSCMSYRATKLTEPPLWIAEEADGRESWVKGDHPLAAVLERPNPDMEMADLLELTSLYHDSTGGCVWVKSRDRAGRVAALYPFSRTDYTPKRTDARLFGEFEVRTSKGVRTYPASEVVHFRNADPADVMGAVAPLDAALGRLGIERTLLDSIRAGLHNSVVPGSVISFPHDVDLTAEQRAEYRASYQAQYEGAKHHGRSLVLGGGASFDRNQIGFAGLEGGELSKETEAAVCSVFKCPPAVVGAYVGLENSSDRHNMEAAIAMFYDNMALPTWARWEKTLTRELLREVDPNPLRFIRFDKSHVRALAADLTRIADVVQKAGRALRVDDARGMMNLELLGGEVGERMVIPSAEPEADEPAPTKRLPVRVEAKAEDADLGRLAIFDALTTAQEAGWEIGAGAQLVADRDAILALARDTLQPGAKDDDVQPADPETVRALIRKAEAYLAGEALSAWRKVVQPLIARGGKQAVERLATELAINFDLLQPGLLDYTEREAAWLIEEIADTTRKAVRRALLAGLEGGESIPQLTKRIADLGVFARSRAETIARTETVRATNGAAHESLVAYAEDSGAVVMKRWLATPDGRTRDAHLKMNGETRPLGEAFSNGLQHPGEPRCRCTVAHTLEEAA